MVCTNWVLCFSVDCPFFVLHCVWKGSLFSDDLTTGQGRLYSFVCVSKWSIETSDNAEDAAYDIKEI